MIREHAQHQFHSKVLLASERGHVDVSYAEGSYRLSARIVLSMYS